MHHGGVDIVDEITHRTLSYVEALNRQGVYPPQRLVDEFARDPDHKVRILTGLQARMMQSFLDGPLFASQRSERESFCQYLTRVGWITNTYEVELTKVGRALLKALNAPVLESATDVIEIVLDPDNPFAYAQAIGALAEPKEALLVEPYFRLEQLMDISELENITRVLVGSRVTQKDIEVLATGLASLDAGRNLKVRQASELHDRYLIPDDGSVLMLGMSLGGIGKKVSTITTLGPEASVALRKAHGTIWSKAKEIKPKKPGAAKKMTATPAKKAAAAKSKTPRS